METNLLIIIIRILASIGIFAILVYVGNYLTHNDRLISWFKN